MIPDSEAYVIFMRSERACQQSRHLVQRARVLMAHIRAQHATLPEPYQYVHHTGLTAMQEQMVITREVLRTVQELFREATRALHKAEAELEATKSELAVMNTELVAWHRQPPRDGGRTAVERP